MAERAELTGLDVAKAVHGHSAGDSAHLTVAVVGLECVGLPTALALQASGLSVIGLAISESRLAAISHATAAVLDASYRTPDSKGWQAI